MKKEVLLAVVFGIVVGLLVTFGIYTANTALQKRAQQSLALPTPTPISETQTGIILYSPEDGTLTDKDKIQVSGMTAPNSLVVIFLNGKEILTTADSKGNFSAELTLTAGSNIITIVATDDEGNQQEEQRTIVFSTANLDDTPSATPTATTKPSPTPTP